MANGAANDAALHIAAAFVGRVHAVADQKRGGADVVGNHAQAFVVQVGLAGFAGGGFDQCIKNINFIVAVHMLQDGGQSLQAHAGVHARRGQLVQGTVCLHVELHEHMVPDLDEAVAVFPRAAGRTAGDVRTVVVKNLAARAARAGIGHHPEVVGRILFAFVVANANHTLGRHPDVFRPDVVGFLVVDVDRHGELVSRQLVDVGQQLPAPLQAVALEVVAKTPVAQHLEKRVVACGVADVFQVIVFAARPQAGLHRGRPHIAAFVAAQKHILELHHAGVGEHQRRVIARHQ